MDEILEAPKPSETLEAPKPSEILDARDVASTHAHVHDLHRVCGNATWEWGRGTLVYHYIRLAAFLPPYSVRFHLSIPCTKPRIFSFSKPNQILSLKTANIIFIIW